MHKYNVVVFRLITIPGAGRSAEMESRFPFRCAPQIAGLRWALKKRRPQHFGNSWSASKESERRRLLLPATKTPYEEGPVIIESTTGDVGADRRSQASQAASSPSIGPAIALAVSIAGRR